MGTQTCGWSDNSPNTWSVNGFWARATTRTKSGSCGGTSVTAAMEARSALYRYNGGTPLLCALSSLESGTSTAVQAYAWSFSDCVDVEDLYANSSIHGGWISGAYYPASGMFPMTSAWYWLDGV